VQVVAVVEFIGQVVSNFLPKLMLLTILEVAVMVESHFKVEPTLLTELV
jgi:hypothetical protein